MNIVFISNYFNHHQKQLSDSLFKLSDNYCFISTREMREERKKLGYGSMEIPDYVISYNTNNKDEIMNIINCADVVIAGSAPEKIITNLVRKKKLVFRYSERPLKKGFEILKYPYRFLRWHMANSNSSRIYMLCASAYASADFSKFFLYKNRMYKWGYFPEAKHYELNSLFKKKKPATILWCGRFLDWKHPEDAIKVAQKLKSEGYNFCLNIIGFGFMEYFLKQMIRDNHLECYVHLLGSMSPDQVRIQMEQSDIFLFTSDRNEGWGAVLNEAMNSGCVVVASHAIGAVPYLLKNNENGFIFKSGDIDEAYKKVEYLLNYPEEQRRLGEEAYKTITEEWNAEIASERFVNLAQHILDGEKQPGLFESGPCSKAEVISDDWYNKTRSVD